MTLSFCGGLWDDMSYDIDMQATVSWSVQLTSYFLMWYMKFDPNKVQKNAPETNSFMAYVLMLSEALFCIKSHPISLKISIVMDNGNHI